eukprot:385656_1
MPAKHPSYGKMIVESIQASQSKMLSKTEITAYLTTNYNGLSNGARFNKAVNNALTKGITSKTIIFDDKKKKYKLGSKAKAKKKSKCKPSAQSQLLAPAPPSRKYPLAYSREYCCDPKKEPTHVISRDHMKQGIDVMKKQIEEKKGEDNTDILRKDVRKSIYRPIAISFIKNKYLHYVDGHQLPGLFRDVVNENFPDKVDEIDEQSDKNKNDKTEA